MLRTAWDRPDLSVLTKVPLTATGTFVVVIGHVTSREFRSRLADSDLAGGTYNRFLPVVVRRSMSLPDGEGLPEQLVASLGQHLKHAVAAARGVGPISRGPAAQRAWRDSMYDEFVEPKGMLDTAAAEFTARAAAYCLRIAALYAALEGLDKISVDHLDAAAALVRYSIQSANSVLGTTHRDPGVATIQAALDAAGRDGCTRTELHLLFAGHLSAARLGAARRRHRNRRVRAPDAATGLLRGPTSRALPPLDADDPPAERRGLIARAKQPCVPPVCDSRRGPYFVQRVMSDPVVGVTGRELCVRRCRFASDWNACATAAV